MRKLLWCLLLSSTVSYAGVIKIRNAGQPDAYVPTMDSDNTSNLTVKGKVVSPIGNITTVNATTVAATNLTGLGTVPVGSIIQSILTLAQFQAQAGTNWVLMNGASIVGSRLATITGWTNLPDATGRFLRTAGGDADPVLAATQGQGTAKNNLTIASGSSVTGITGTNSAATVSGSISQSVKGAANGVIINPGMDSPTQTEGWSGYTLNRGTNILGGVGTGDFPGINHTHTWSGTTSQATWAQSGTGTAAAQTISSIDTETRPVNLTVNTFIRIN